MPNEWLAPVMFAVTMLLIFSGFPVAFTLGGTALVFAGVAMAMGSFDGYLLMALPERVFGFMSNYVLLAIPFFILMGTVLEKGRLAEDLLKTIGALFGRMRGGLGLAVVLVGTLLAAATGVIGASVVAMGMISLPVMMQYGYSRSFSAGIIAASGTLGQIIPPSIVLVVLGDQLGVSVGDLFLGALLPGLVLAGAYAVYAGVIAWLRPNLAPALPPEECGERGMAMFVRVLKTLVPPLALILIVLGSIFAGVATPTEAGALGAVGAIVLAAIQRRLTRPMVMESAMATVRLTSMVMMLLIGSTVFSLVFRGLHGDLWMEDMLTTLPGGRIGFLLTANIVVFGLGFFIDFFEICFIIVPLLLPAARALDINLVWFGVMLGMNLQISFLTPPFGFALFYLRGVMPPEIKTAEMYRGVIPFIGIQVIALTVMILFPGLVAR
ncbi:MAG: TRAP transporter large permease subunit [Kiritimatiellae bacterium]|nr:TRAP transporter large permease subunit [Kiritimatiellia bacterium]